MPTRADRPPLTALKVAAAKVLGRALAPTELAIYTSLHRAWPRRLTPRKIANEHLGGGLTYAGIDSALRRMVERGLLEPDGAGRERVYDFPEAIIAEARA